jgi:hypothetical protein
MEAFFCTAIEATPAQILEWAVRRWSVEATFPEVRAHLGLETQRQWSDGAIDRTTPVLMTLFLDRDHAGFAIELSGPHPGADNRLALQG